MLQTFPLHAIPGSGPLLPVSGKTQHGEQVYRPANIHLLRSVSVPSPPSCNLGWIVGSSSAGLIWKKEILRLMCQHCPLVLCPSLACAAGVIIHLGSLGLFFFFFFFNRTMGHAGSYPNQ